MKNFFTQFIRDLIFKYFRHYAWPRRISCRMFDFDDYYSSSNELLINLGAGPYFKRRGWISADFIKGFGNLKDRVELDLSKNINQLPFHDVKAIYLSHVLEHFSLHDGHRLLTSIFSSLQSGGFIRIIVPCADLILDKVKCEDVNYFRPLFPYFKTTKDSELTSIDLALHLLSQPRCRFQHSTDSLKNENDLNEYFFNKNNDEIISILNDHNFSQNNDGSLHLCAYNFNLLQNVLKKIGFTQVYKSSFMQSRFGPMREAPIFDGTHPWLSLYVEAIK